MFACAHNASHYQDKTVVFNVYWTIKIKALFPLSISVIFFQFFPTTNENSFLKYWFLIHRFGSMADLSHS